MLSIRQPSGRGRAAPTPLTLAVRMWVTPCPFKRWAVPADFHISLPTVFLAHQMDDVAGILGVRDTERITQSTGAFSSMSPHSFPIRWSQVIGPVHTCPHFFRDVQVYSDTRAKWEAGCGMDSVSSYLWRMPLA